MYDKLSVRASLMDAIKIHYKFQTGAIIS